MNSVGRLSLSLLLSATLVGQDHGSRPEALLDPAGTFTFRVGDLTFELRFAPFDVPAPGNYGFGDGDGLPQLWFRSEDTVPRRVHSAQLAVVEFGPERVRGTLEWTIDADAKPGEAKLDVVPTLGSRVPASVRNARVIDVEAPVDRAAQEDLVFCAIGSGGTGLPGQKRVADAIARLAPTGPLDFVLLLGDNLYPAGVTGITDGAWRSRFEEVYDRKALAVPFYVALGQHDLRGDLNTLVGYGATNLRWTLPRNSYSFEKESHGKRIGFVALDTTTLMGSISHPLSRMSRSVVAQALEVSRADWRIVFGHHPMYSRGENADPTVMARLRELIEPWMEKYRVDLYISGDDRSMQLLTPNKGVTHIGSGGGGGPEVAESVDWAEDTVFAATGGGFSWFRFDGETLEVSFRDVDGKPLYVHRLRKTR